MVAVREVILIVQVDAITSSFIIPGVDTEPIALEVIGERSGYEGSLSVFEIVERFAMIAISSTANHTNLLRPVWLVQKRFEVSIPTARPWLSVGDVSVTPSLSTDDARTHRKLEEQQVLIHHSGRLFAPNPP